MKVTLAIPTFNRREGLEVSAGVLNRMPWLDRVNLRVYDDASSLSLDALRSLYPTAMETVKRPKNLGPSGNIRQIFFDFLKTQDDCLVMLDSDLIVSEKVLDVLLSAMPHTEGILSLYNSCRHPSHQTIRCGEHAFQLKRTIGSAGSALTRQRVEEIVKHVPDGRSFDFRMCRYLLQQGHQVYVTSNSYVQHIGFEGYHCKQQIIDFGLSFDCDDQLTKAAMYPILAAAILESHQTIERFDQELGIHVRYTGKILERSVRRPLKKWLRKLSWHRETGEKSCA